MDQLFDLVRDFSTSFSPNVEGLRSAFNAVSKDEAADLLCSFSGSDMTGYVLAFTHAAFFANGQVTWVEEIYVRPEHRRQGIATALMRAVESHAVRRGSKLVALATRRADDFYRALNYEESATYYRRLL